jgi:hypothetical protein
MAGMKKTDYLEMRRKIQREYEDKLEALNKVYEMFGGNPVPVSNGNSSTPTDWTANISKRDAVRNAIQELELSQFTLQDVRDIFEAKFAQLSNAITDNQLSAILAKLAEMGEFTVIKKKAGKSSAIYGKKKLTEGV